MSGPIATMIEIERAIRDKQADPVDVMARVHVLVDDYLRGVPRDEAGRFDPPHEHQWIPVGAAPGDSFGSYVLFGCTCGEARRTQATDTPASRLKVAVREVIFGAKPVDWLMAHDEESETLKRVKIEGLKSNGQPALAVPVYLLDKLREAIEG